MKYTTRQIIWNNVRFIPEQENMWYRGIDEGKIYNSSLRKGNRTITVSLFTYGDDCREGWSASVYEENNLIAFLDLQHQNYIKAKDVNDAENQALEWSKQIICLP
jgi:hypothetical protein